MTVVGYGCQQYDTKQIWGLSKLLRDPAQGVQLEQSGISLVRNRDREAPVPNINALALLVLQQRVS